MSSNTQIKQLDKLLGKYLGEDKMIKNNNTSRLTAPGENYGSIMYRVDMEVHDKTKGTDEILNAVAKTLPEGEMLRKMFNIQVTYTNEMAFYEVIVPTLQSFHKELGIRDVIDLFPRCIATRKNLKQNSDVIDDDAVIVLENLYTSGFENSDRLKGIDLETSKLILEDIAHFHAASLALKLKKPEIFKEKVRKYCIEYVPIPLAEVEEIIPAVLSENPQTAKFVSKINAWGKVRKIKPREPFATLLHQDLWVNNTMQKFEKGKPVSNKFVDFQIIDYGSPASDVFFFIWSSIPRSILQDNLDNLLEYYHENLLTYLEKHNCDTELFSYDKFLEEIEAVADYEIGHALGFHLFVVNGKKGGHDSVIPTVQEFLEHLPAEAKEKAWYMVEECHKRGWLK